MKQRIEKSKAKALLTKSIEAIDGLREKHEEPDAFTKWKRGTEVAIENIFPKDSRHLKEFKAISYHAPPRMVAVARKDGTIWPPPQDDAPFYDGGMRRAKAILESMVDEIETYWSEGTDTTSQAKTELEASADRRFTDRELMERTIELARKCVSEPGKNSPKVAAIVAKDGLILAEAYRGEVVPGDHAEFTVFEKKLREEMLTGATLFTTLEPCTKRGPDKVPCAERTIERHIRKVFIGTLDRNKKILGKGQLALIDAGIQVAHYDPDLVPVLEELNRENIRQYRSGRKRRTSAETSDPVKPDAVGPNGYKIGYLPNGDKVEWLPDDEAEGEFWPMVLRRNDNDILNEYNELWEKVWYVRKLIHQQKMESGEIPMEDPNQPHLLKARERMRQIEKKYGKENLGWDDVEWGLIQGRLSALSWVLGAEWDESLDT